MKIVVDEVLCAGHGVCEDVAPELFAVDDSGMAHVLIEEIGDEYLEKAKLAILRCPAEAITLIR
jgi:ferredoxin